MDIPELETEKLLLRGPRAEDFAAYQAFYGDADASAFYGGPLPPHKAWGILASDLGHWQLRGYGRWTIEIKANGQVAGGCGLWWPEGWPRSELTWWIMPAARRQGIATEASLAAIEFAYQTLEWPRVETHMDDDNIAARGLAERLDGTVIAREAFPDGQERDVFALPRARTG